MVEETKEKIIKATYDVICEEGYASLSMQKIADKVNKRKSLIYHHYQNKEELLISFLEKLKQKIEEDMKELSSQEPEKALEDYLTKILCTKEPEIKNLRKTLIEMRIQAPHNKKFKEKFKEIDDYLLQKLKEILKRNNIKNIKEKSEIIMSYLEGQIYRKITLEENIKLEENQKTVKRIINKT